MIQFFFGSVFDFSSQFFIFSLFLIQNSRFRTRLVQIYCFIDVLILKPVLIALIVITLSRILSHSICIWATPLLSLFLFENLQPKVGPWTAFQWIIRSMFNVHRTFNRSLDQQNQQTSSSTSQPKSDNEIGTRLKLNATCSWIHTNEPTLLSTNWFLFEELSDFFGSIVTDVAS